MKYKPQFKVLSVVILSTIVLSIGGKSRHISDSRELASKTDDPAGVRADPGAAKKTSNVTRKYRIAAANSKKPASKYSAPLSRFRITSGYGYRIHPITGGRNFHAGVDFAARLNEPVYTIFSGTVVRAGWRGALGNSVEVRSGNTSAIYGHLNKIRVSRKDKVVAGQNIGLVGSTGRSTGPHLHLTIRRNRVAISPIAYLNDIQKGLDTSSTVIAGRKSTSVRAVVKTAGANTGVRAIAVKPPPVPVRTYQIASANIVPAPDIAASALQIAVKTGADMGSAAQAVRVARAKRPSAQAVGIARAKRPSAQAVGIARAKRPSAQAVGIARAKRPSAQAVGIARAKRPSAQAVRIARAQKRQTAKSIPIARASKPKAMVVASKPKSSLTPFASKKAVTIAAAPKNKPEAIAAAPAPVVPKVDESQIREARVQLDRAVAESRKFDYLYNEGAVSRNDAQARRNIAQAAKERLDALNKSEG